MPPRNCAIIAGMRRALVIAVAVGLFIAAAPAQAQFYDLDGAYRCLKSPDPDCEKGLTDRPQVPPPAPPSKPVGPSFSDIIAHVRDRTAGQKDIDQLARLSAANDPRAVEVLAWCKLNGIGTARDALAAYRLYGQAAGLGVAHARENQISVFERQLTAEQRQEVLMSENKPGKP
jgi:TPR repeat protein